jgi:hypothetical protein
MKFVFPEILWALFALIIPIIVHLFNFRKFRKVIFPNVAFLKEVKQETQSKSRIKHWLILATRLLALAAIIFAFAQPYLPLKGSTASVGDKVVSIYIDNSFSMEAENQDGRLLDLAKNKAFEIAEYYKATDKFQLLTNDFEARHQRLVSRDEILDLIEEVDVSSNVAMVSDVVSRQLDLISNLEAESKSLYLVSDWQKTTHDFQNVAVDSTIKVQLVPNFFEAQDNVYIDSVWFSTPVRQINLPEVLNIRLKSTHDQPVKDVPVKLYVNGIQRALGSFTVLPNEPCDTSLAFTHTGSGFKKAQVSLTDHPVTFDDSFFFSYHVAEKIPVLEIKGRNSTSRHFAKIFDNDDFFEFISLTEIAVDYSTLTDFNLIIVNDINTISSGLAGELAQFIENGGSVLIIPHADSDVTSYSSLFRSCGAIPWVGKKVQETKVSNINLDHPIYKDVFEDIPRNIDLPKVSSFYYGPTLSKSNTDALLSLQSGEPFLNVYDHGLGNFYVFSVSLDPQASNLAEHALFVASALRIAEFSVPKSPLYYTIGEDEAISLSKIETTGDQVLHLSDSTVGLDFLPGFRQIGGVTELFLHGQLTKAGNYDLKNNLSPLAVLGFNYSRKESLMDYYSLNEATQLLSEVKNLSILDAELQSLKRQVQELDEGIKLWYLLIILTLVFLALEILLIKVWK